MGVAVGLLKTFPPVDRLSLHCALASCGTVYCNRSVSVCLCVWVCLCICGCVCLWVCYHDNSQVACIYPHQTGSVGKGSDYLQMIKFWPYAAPPGRGLRRGEIFWLRLTTASTQCLRLSDRFFSHSISGRSGTDFGRKKTDFDRLTFGFFLV